MRRSLTTLGTVIASFAVSAPAAWAMHAPSDNAKSTSSGFPWHTVLIWGGIGVGVVLVATWTIVEARRHHWHIPHRAVHA